MFNRDGFTCEKIYYEMALCKMIYLYDLICYLVPTPLYLKLVASGGLKTTSLREKSMLTWLADSQSMPNITSKSCMFNTNNVTSKTCFAISI